MSPEDGLKYRVIGKNTGNNLQMNILPTKIKGTKHKKPPMTVDKDSRSFSVKYNAVRTSQMTMKSDS